MFDDLLESKIIKLLNQSNQKRLEGQMIQSRVAITLSLAMHPIEKCITLKECIMQLDKDRKIILDLDDTAEANCI